MISTTINDRCQLDEELGRGGMGTIFQAFDNVLERDADVYVLSGAGLRTGGRVCLRQEAKAVALNHPDSRRYIN